MKIVRRSSEYSFHNLYYIFDAVRLEYSPYAYSEVIRKKMEEVSKNVEMLLQIGAKLFPEEKYKKLLPEKSFHLMEDELIFSNIKSLFMIGSVNDTDYFSLSISECLKIYSQNDGVVYDQYSKLKTDVVRRVVVSEGSGRDFSWWTEYHNLSYIVFAKEGVRLSKKQYTLKEVSQLVNNGEIVIVDVRREEIQHTGDYMKELNQSKKYDRNNIDYPTEHLLKDLDDVNHKYHKTYVKYVLSFFTKEILNSEIKAQIKYCTSLLAKPASSKLRSLCNDEYVYDISLGLSTPKEAEMMIQNYLDQNHLISYTKSRITRLNLYKRLMKIYSSIE
ncbi:MAG: hypothetical protein IJ215_02760 [Clostridia bacterium]|nr:hypothetical protein [Clostridia bacterium]